MSWHWWAWLGPITLGVIYVATAAISGWVQAWQRYYIGRYDHAQNQIIEARDERDRALNRNLLDHSQYAKEIEKQKLKHDFEIKRLKQEIGRMHKEVRLMAQESRE
jgi:hypothetical protein